MRRRDFITSVAGAVTWPLAARAQQPTMPVIGFVHARSNDETMPLVAAFLKGLSNIGFIENQTVAIEFRFAGGQYDQLPHLVADLIDHKVAVLVAGADPAALAAKRSTQSLPIVFSVGSDPVTLGLVASLNRPGGNATGMAILTALLEQKRLSLLREILPAASTVGVLLNPKSPPAEIQGRAVQDAAGSLKFAMRPYWAGDDDEMTKALGAIAHDGISALMISADPYFDSRRTLITNWTKDHKLPTMFQFREYPVSGGLMSYGPNLPDIYRQLGDYACRVLKGENPAEMPVLQPTKFDFVINQKTASVLGISIPSG
jgi:putative ABC transport system substrate-binding protein